MERRFQMDFDTEVKLHLYRVIAETTLTPTSSEVAQALKCSVEEVEAAFQRLYQKRLLVLEPGSTSKIRMAPPFSGIETPFLVVVGGKSYYANCAWDALGIPAALHQDGDVTASDAFTGEAMSLQVRDQNPVPQECVIHFAVPAARWWDDIIYT
jgi:DNA-binding transcriptional MocR family regulator